MDQGKGVPIALQLYTVRDRTERDFAGTMRDVAKIGYRAVEFAGYGGLDATELTSVLAETRLTPAASHVSLERLEQDARHEIDFCRSIGCPYVILPGVSSAYHDTDGIYRLADRLNDIGRQCLEQGVHFAYHNHDWEFARHGDRSGLEILLEETDSTTVGFELDVYWTAHAGVEPARFLRRHADRFALLHLKDRAADGDFAEVGDGDLGIAAIYALAADIGVEWCVVENDAPRLDSLASARRSWQNLQAMATAT